MLSDRAPVDRTERLVVRGTHELAAARRVARATAASVVGDRRADDVALVTSELVTNALEHGSGGPVEVVASTTGGAVEVEVGSSSSELPVPPARPRTPAPEVRGRGLQIVVALSDNVVISGEDDHVRVTCRFEGPGHTSR